MKKPTIRDVAREAGVSTTTVSHVLNGRAAEMRICEATRKKVLQVVNLLDYTPSSAARELAGKLNYRIAFSAVIDGIFPATQYAVTAENLAQLLKKRGRSLVVHHADDFSAHSGVDAIICFGFSAERFRKLGEESFIPLVAADSLINDPLYFQVTQDFKRLRAEADSKFGGSPYSYAYIPHEDEAANKAADAAFNETIRVAHVCELRKLDGKNIIVSDTALKAVLPTAYHSETYENRCLAAALDCADKGINREQVDGGGHFVVI